MGIKSREPSAASLSKGSSSPPTSSSSTHNQHTPIVCLLHSMYIFPSSVSAVASDGLCAWHIGLFNWPSVIEGGVTLQFVLWGKRSRRWGKKKGESDGMRRGKWDGSTENRKMSDLKKEKNKCFLCFKWRCDGSGGGVFLPDVRPPSDR